jgi:hypothetical protein
VQALREWERQEAAPRTPNELVLVADGLAAEKDVRALPVLDKLRAYMPVEADAITATLYLQRGEFEQAAAFLERAFSAYRSDPWPLTFVMKNALSAARALSRGRPELARRVESSLAEPFAVRVLDFQRQLTRFHVSMEISGDSCQQALAPFDLYPEWDRTFLDKRVQCLERGGDPSAAQQDLVDFLAAEPSPFTGSKRATEAGAGISASGERGR